MNKRNIIEICYSKTNVEPTKSLEYIIGDAAIKDIKHTAGTIILNDELVTLDIRVLVVNIGNKQKSSIFINRLKELIGPDEVYYIDKKIYVNRVPTLFDLTSDKEYLWV